MTIHRRRDRRDACNVSRSSRWLVFLLFFHPPPPSSVITTSLSTTLECTRAYEASKTNGVLGSVIRSARSHILCFVSVHYSAARFRHASRHRFQQHTVAPPCPVHGQSGVKTNEKSSIPIDILITFLVIARTYRVGYVPRIYYLRVLTRKRGNIERTRWRFEFSFIRWIRELLICTTIPRTRDKEKEKEKQKEKERKIESTVATYLRIIMIKYFFGHKYTSRTRDPRGAAHPTHIARCIAR